MQSTKKQQRQGKSGKKLENLQVQRQRYKDDEVKENKWPGAYKMGTDVLCLMRDNTEWRLAEVIAVREAKFFDEEIDDASSDSDTLYDDIPVQEHPTGDQDKKTYLQKYMKEFKDDFDFDRKPIENAEDEDEMDTGNKQEDSKD
jgi:hypothetical protein